METFEIRQKGMMFLILLLGTVMGLVTPWQSAQAQSGHPLLGGPHGVVHAITGEPLEGILVQLVAQSNAIRTTVYSNDSG